MRLFWWKLLVSVVNCIFYSKKFESQLQNKSSFEVEPIILMNFAAVTGSDSRGAELTACVSLTKPVQLRSRKDHDSRIVLARSEPGCNVISRSNQLSCSGIIQYKR